MKARNNALPRERKRLCQAKLYNLNIGEMAEWLTRSPGANGNVEAKRRRPRRGGGQEARNNALPGERKRLRQAKLYNLNIGEMAEWLKALPC